METPSQIHLVTTFTVFMLASGLSFGQDTSQNTQASQSAVEQAGLADIGSLSFKAELRCGPLKTETKNINNTPFARAEAARQYESCVKGLFAQARTVQVRTADTAHMLALQNVESVELANASRLLAVSNASASFMGLNFGLGFGYSFGTDDIIEDAEIVNGIVRVTDDRTNQARVLLEFHRYFWCREERSTTSGVIVERGCGPFVALAASSDDILKGVAVGFIWGWRSKNPAESDGFSIGIGAILDNDVRSLADGFVENQPPPAGETSVRFKNEARWSGLLFVTRTF